MKKTLVFLSLLAALLAPAQNSLNPYSAWPVTNGFEFIVLTTNAAGQIVTARANPSAAVSAGNAVTNNQTTAKIGGVLLKNNSGSPTISGTNTGNYELVLDNGETGSASAYLGFKKHAQGEGEISMNCGQYGSSSFYISALNEDASGMGGNAFLRSAGITINFDDAGVMSFVGDQSGTAFEYNDDTADVVFSLPLRLNAGVKFGYTGIVTNWSVGGTSNRIYFSGGVVTNVTKP